MRALEPRLLLDAASAETALDMAGKAAHEQLADDYIANGRTVSAAMQGSAERERLAMPFEQEPAAENETAEESVSSESATNEIVFIDSAVEDIDGLIASLEPGAAVHIINADSDGLQQIFDVMSNGTDYDAVHIFSHGSPGSLQLGDTIVNATTMAGDHAELLAGIGQLLSEDADILLYGCRFGEGESGRAAADLLAIATGADIAASDDLTGSESLSGDWDLEVRVGEVSSRSYTLPDWEGILPGFELGAVAPPDYTHASGGTIGTAGTIVTWAGAATRDPSEGGPLETYDVRAIIVGATDKATATFENVATTDGSLADFRIVITNIGDVTGSIGSDEILEEQSVTVLWQVIDSVTGNPAPADVMNIVLRDIDGLAGMPDTRNEVGIVANDLSSYTVESTTDLQVSVDDGTLVANGTQPGTNALNSQLGATWASSNRFAVTYTTFEQTATFDLDGDGGATFNSPVTTDSQTLDLNGSGAGVDYVTTYFNGAISGSDDDVPVAIADVDISIFDLDTGNLTGSTITLTNAQPGDVLNFDNAVLNALSISATYTDNGTDIVLQLNGFASTENYETAIRSITYSNGLPDGTGVGTIQSNIDRLISVDINDNFISTTGVQTRIVIADAGAAPVAGTNIFVADEDSVLTVNAANGLLSDDSDPQGSSLTLVSALDSLGNPISLSGAFTLPSGAMLSLAADGSFTYVPDTHYSGSETIRYTVSDGSNTAESFATFSIQPVADNVVLNITQNAPVSNEDQPTNSIQINAFSPDTSETQDIFAEDIPAGVILTDGVNEYESDGTTDFVEITNWDLNNLRILPLQNRDTDVTITLIATTYEEDGSTSEDIRSVTFEIDAVADRPTLIVLEGGGGIDEDVVLFDLISPQLFDTDGSEQITDITISDIPTGAQILVNNVAQPINSGSVSLQMVDLLTAVFRPPQTGANAIYDMLVSATATEVNPELGGNVAVLSATESNIGLRIDLNDDDDPVVAADDFATTFTGETVSIDVISNDFAPDGGAIVTHINGTLIDVPTPYTLPGGQGVIRLGLSGELIYEAASNYSGTFDFTYTLQDADFDEDDASVTITVNPRWEITSLPAAQEGGNAEFTVTLQGALPQGSSADIDIAVQFGTADASDIGALTTAINNAIALPGNEGFSFDGTTLNYTAPPTTYTPVYDPTGSTFIDISATAMPLNLGNDGLAAVSLPFGFEFYGSSFNDLFVSTNGYLTFGTPVSAPDNQALDGTALTSRPIIAPFWDDLGTTVGDVFVQSQGQGLGGRQFIIQWEMVNNESDASGTGRFQVVLDEGTGSVRFNYADVTFAGTGDNGAGATIGLQGSGLSNQFSFNQPGAVVGGSSLLFAPAIAVNPSLTIEIPIIDDPDFETQETFSLVLTNPIDSGVGSNNAMTTIDVSDNTAPVATDDVANVLETSTATFNVIQTGVADSDAEGHTLTLTAINGSAMSGAGTQFNLASGAVLTAFPDGTVTYDPNGAFVYLGNGDTANDTFTYEIDDGFGGTDTATVTVTVDGENQAAFVDLNDNGTTPGVTRAFDYQPTDGAIGVADAAAVIVDPDDTEFRRMFINLSGFVQPGNEIVSVGTFQLVFGTSGSGTITIGSTTFSVGYNGSNQINISNSLGGVDVPRADFEALVRSVTYNNTSSDDTPGVRTLAFFVDDGDGIGTSSVSEITVIGNNIAPVANADGTAPPFDIQEDTSLVIPLTTLTANDSDPDGDAISIVAVDGGANGSAVLDGMGNAVFTPSADFNGSTVFTYTLRDSRGAISTGQVFVNVTPVNDAPSVDLDGATAGIDYAFTYTENDPATPIITATGLLTDIDGGQLVSTTISLANGQVDDVITIGTLPGGITASVNPPEAVTGLAAAGPVTITLSGVASVADYDTALRAIGFSVASDQPVEGNRTITVVTSDGVLSSPVATATITVVAVNDIPVAVDDGPLSVTEDTPRIIPRTAFLGNDSDADGDALSIVSVDNAVNGTVSLVAGNNVLFTPDANYFGPASFTYTIGDGNGGQTTATATIQVVAVNDIAVLDLDANIAGADFATSYTEDNPGVPLVDASVSVTDIDSPTFSSATISLTNGQIGDLIEAGTMPSGITASIVPSGAVTSADTLVTVTLTGTASPAAYETALQALTFRSTSDAPSLDNRVVTIRVNDGSDDSNIALTSISITAVNDAPVAGNDTFTVAEDTVRTFTPAELTANDSDPDIEPVFIVSVGAATNGTVILNGDGTVTFTPDADHSGSASFTYTIGDGNGGQSTATVNLTVTPVDDPAVLDLDANTLGSDFTTSFTENNAAVRIVDPTLSIVDIDSATLSAATIILTNAQVGDDFVTSPLPGGITATETPAGTQAAPGIKTLTLSGIASVADYETAVRSIFYLSRSDTPSIVDRSITISVNDGTSESNIATTTVSVIATNDAPVAADDGPFTVDEDTILVLAPAALLFNDSDPDGDPLTLVSVQGAIGGGVLINGDGNIAFTPTPNTSGPASFTYTIEDSSGVQSTATVVMTVLPINDAPTLDADAGTVGVNYATAYTEGTVGISLVDATVLLNDSDDTQIESATIILINGFAGDLLEAGTLPAGIAASISPSGPLAANGSVTLTLSGSASIADYQTALQAVVYRSTSGNIDTTNRSISIVVNDGEANSNSAITTVAITAVNDAPVATDDGPFTIDEDTALNLPVTSLLFNDNDPEGQAVTLVSVQDPVNGTVVFASGVITFTPTPEYSGPASFTYMIDDGSGTTDTATVTIDVVSVNDLAQLDLDGGTIGSDYVTSWVENDPGVALLDPTSTLIDVDNPNLTSATFVLINGQADDVLEVGSLPPGITVSTTPPSALALPGPFTLTLSGLASQADYLAALQAVTFRSLSNNPDETPRTINVLVNDGINNSDVATTTVAVTSVNDSPVANTDGPFSTDEDVALIVAAADLLSNDLDPEGTPLTLVSVQDAVNGNVTLTAGTITFMPDGNYFGPASFSYTVRDADGGTTLVPVDITVNSVNDVPLVDLDATIAGTGFQTTYTENSAAVDIVSANISVFDVDHPNIQSATIVLTNGMIGDLLSVGALPTSVTATISPAVALAGNGTVTVTLSGGASHADYEAALQAITFSNNSENPDTTRRVIEIGINDGTASSNIALSNIDVVSVNDAPVAVDDGVPVPLAGMEDTPLTFNPVAANDTDVEGDLLSIVEIDGSTIVPGGSVVLANGTVSLDVDGVTLTFEPLANFNGFVNFNYTVSDGVLSDTAAVIIDVAAVNDAPVALNDGPVVLIEDGFAFFDPVSTNDTDVEGDALTITAIDGQPISIGGTIPVADGTVSLGANGRTIQFVPNANFNGSSSIIYTVSDGQATSDAVVTFDVTPVDDPVTVAMTPPNASFADGETVSLPMVGFFNDPDGDVLTFSATGLPGGLAINSATGVIEGTVGSDASQFGPYSVTVSVDDGVSGSVSTSFLVNVINTLPVSVGDQTVSVDDGASLNIDANTLFTDADGDALFFSISGLPTWLSFDASTGILSGTAPSDASVSGPVVVTVAADDQQGGVSSIDLTIDPQNPAPVATRTLPDLRVGEQDAVDVDLSGLFVDGGSDSDPITVSVTGLPDGVTFDPLTGLISGTISDGAGLDGPYRIAVTADDGQGGVTTVRFTINIGNPQIIEDDDIFTSVSEIPEAVGTDENDDDTNSGFIGQIVDEISSLNSVGGLSQDNGVILSAIEEAQSLRQATGPATSGSNGDVISSLANIAEPDGWVSQSQWVNEGDWNVETSHPFASLVDNGPAIEQPPEIQSYAHEAMPLLQLVASKQNGTFYLELRNGLNLLRDGKLIEMDLTLSNGNPLPNWIEFVRPGFATANPPEGTTSIDIKMRAALDSGTTVEKLIHIDFAILLDASADKQNLILPDVAEERVPEKVIFTP